MLLVLLEAVEDAEALTTPGSTGLGPARMKSLRRRRRRRRRGRGTGREGREAQLQAGSGRLALLLHLLLVKRKVVACPLQQPWTW